MTADFAALVPISAIDPVVGVVAGALVSGIIGVVVASRRMSGKIKTSSADELWEESRSIRNDYRDRLNSSYERQAAVEGRMANIEAKHAECVEENSKLRNEVTRLEEIIDDLRGTIERMEAR